MRLSCSGSSECSRPRGLTFHLVPAELPHGHRVTCRNEMLSGVHQLAFDHSEGVSPW